MLRLNNMLPVKKRGLLLMVLSVFSNSASAALFDSKIMRAARKGDVPTLRAELDKGADINERRGMGETLLLVAAQRGHLDAVQLLLERGADPNLATVGRSTASHYAAWKGQTEAPGSIWRDIGGEAPLHGKA